jgi:hypothetical protein
MLSKDEEKRLEGIIEEIGTEGWGQYPEADYRDVRWLVSRLQEINNEAAHYSQELQNTNEALIACYEGHDR